MAHFQCVDAGSIPAACILHRFGLGKMLRAQENWTIRLFFCTSLEEKTETGLVQW
jgi:hypothetical protein